jgi:hypothetical protein
VLPPIRLGGARHQRQPLRAGQPAAKADADGTLARLAIDDIALDDSVLAAALEVHVVWGWIAAWWILTEIVDVVAANDPVSEPGGLSVTRIRDELPVDWVEQRRLLTTASR